MSTAGSVTVWIRKLDAGDQVAFQQIWEGYYRRLVGLARRKLRGLPGGAVDGEDVALSAFDSFFRGAEEGRFPKLSDRHDLWQVLVLLASRKAVNQVKRELRARRGGGRVVQASALAAGAEEEEEPLFAALIGREPEPAFAAEVAEEFRRLLGRLPDDALQLRSVAVWKLEGYTNEEIAGKLGRSLATVERRLGLIRRTWQQETTP
jgi:DNA-directed RNA polymerase specialized sigma24 family protein